MSKTLLTILSVVTLFFVTSPVFGSGFNVSVNNGKCNNKYSESTLHVSSNSVGFGSSRLQKLQSPEFVLEQTLKKAINGIENSEVKTIVLDPGHGGKDQGCSGGEGIYEKTITLSIAKLVGKYLEDRFPEINIIYTRKTDKFVSLNKRAEIANSNEADLFISIHCNAIRKNGKVRGSETYVMGLKKASENQQVIERMSELLFRENEETMQFEENYRETYSDYFASDSPINAIMSSSLQQGNLDLSVNLAEKVEKKMKGDGRWSRGVHQAGFVVLRRTTMPSILIETGFLSNNLEKKYLNSDKGKREVAHSIFEAIEEYKEENDDAFGIKSVDYQLPDVSGDSGSSIPEEYSQPVEIPKELVDNPEGDVLITKEEPVQYGIVIAESVTPISEDSEVWPIHFKNHIVSKFEEGTFKYVVFGYGGNLSKAKTDRRTLIKMGYKDSEIVSYGEFGKISLEEAERILNLSEE